MTSASADDTGVAPSPRSAGGDDEQASEPALLEGTPANPHVGPRQISLMLSLTVISLLLAGLGIAIAVDPLVGGLAGILALALLLFNPAFWASVLRARERAAAEQRSG